MLRGMYPRNTNLEPFKTTGKLNCQSPGEHKIVLSFSHNIAELDKVERAAQVFGSSIAGGAPPRTPNRPYDATARNIIQRPRLAFG